MPLNTRDSNGRVYNKTVHNEKNNCNCEECGDVEEKQKQTEKQRETEDLRKEKEEGYYDEDDKDPFEDVGLLLEKGAQNYYKILHREMHEGYLLYTKKYPGARYCDEDEEIYQTLFCLERYGKIIPYQKRTAVLLEDDPSPWMRIGRPSKVELLSLVLFALGKYSGKDDAAVLLSRDEGGMILGFDYNIPEEEVNYIMGSSLLINFPSHLAKEGILITLKAPDKFILLQAENKGIKKIIYHLGELGRVEKDIVEKMTGVISVEKMPWGFWHYKSVVGEDTSKIPHPFEHIHLNPKVTPIELAGFIALIVRTRANCLKRKVGAVLIDLYDDGMKGKIRSLGYNGFKSMFMSETCDRFFCNKRRYGPKNDELCYSPCAEIDAFRGYYHDASLTETFYRQTTRKKKPEAIWTAAVTTIEPCERCTSILFEDGIFDFYPLKEYKPDRTHTLKLLTERGKINVNYLGNDFWKKW
ncbi:MAG: hypothetical protein QW728_02910 [Thermoplasmata archaeon]